MQRAFITGIKGQDGSDLAETLLERATDVGPPNGSGRCTSLP
jgi:GDP-D-mannose dehydratase